MVQEEPQDIVASVGTLQAKVCVQDPKRVAVVCHPHPLYQGTMDNKVVTTCVRAWQDYGLSTIRFNFRGVGTSQGSYGDGVGEAQDLRDIISWASKHFPGHRLWLGGFSFGAAIALRVAHECPHLARLIIIAPAIHLFKELPKIPQVPWRMIIGDEDEVIPLGDLKAWCDNTCQGSSEVEIIQLKGADHFFHGKLIDLKTLIVI